MPYEFDVYDRDPPDVYWGSIRVSDSHDKDDAASKAMDRLLELIDNEETDLYEDFTIILREED